MNNSGQYNLYEQSKKRKKYIIFAIIVVLFLGIGYAYLQTLLTISGTTNVRENTWSVYWNNIQVNSNSVSTSASSDVAATYSPVPTTLSEQTSITFNVTLDKPGDFYEFTVDAVNAGSIDAMIASGSIVKEISEGGRTLSELELPSYLEYDVTYDDEIEDVSIGDYHELKAGHSEKYRVRVGYKKNINAGDLPGDDHTYTVTFAVNYVQADGNSIPVPNRVFYVGNNLQTTGSALSNNIGKFSSYQDARDEFGHPVFIRYKMNNNLISQPYLGIEKNGQLYYFPTGNNYLEYNIQQLTSLFPTIEGVSGCVVDNDSMGSVYCIEADGDDVAFAISIVWVGESQLFQIISDGTLSVINENGDMDYVDGYACGVCGTASLCTSLTDETAIQNFADNCPILQ